jgi:hypothetical protein
MEFQEINDLCVKALRRMPGVHGAMCCITNGDSITSYNHDHKRVLVQAHDAFEAVKWFLDIENEVFTMGALQDPIVLLSDKEIMIEQDKNRMESHKYSYPWLEVRYGR